MANILIVATDTGFPEDFHGTAQEWVDAFLLYLGLTIPDTNIILGKVGGTAPTSDVGPWADTVGGGVWKYWNGTIYVPFRLLVGDIANTVEIKAGTLTANRIQTLQDKDGVLAFTTDVFTGRATTVLTGTTPILNWSTTNTFSITLSGNTTFTSTLSQPGQEVYVAITNPSTYTVTWPALFRWPGGAPGAQSVTNKTDVYRLKNVAGTIYGEHKLDFS